MEEQPSAQPNVLEEGQHLIFLEEDYFLLFSCWAGCYHTSFHFVETAVEGQNFAHCNILIKIKRLTTFSFLMKCCQIIDPM